MVFSPEENFRDLSGFEIQKHQEGRKFRKNLRQPDREGHHTRQTTLTTYLPKTYAPRREFRSQTTRLLQKKISWPALPLRSGLPSAECPWFAVRKSPDAKSRGRSLRAAPGANSLLAERSVRRSPSCLSRPLQTAGSQTRAWARSPSPLARILLPVLPALARSCPTGIASASRTRGILCATTRYARLDFPPARGFTAAARTLRDKFAISIADRPASNPLLPPFSPARSMACSSVSQVSTQNMMGTPESICASCKPRAVSEHT